VGTAIRGRTPSTAPRSAHTRTACNPPGGPRSQPREVHPPRRSRSGSQGQGCPSWIRRQGSVSWGARQTSEACNRCLACSNTVSTARLWQRSDRSPPDPGPNRANLGPNMVKLADRGAFSCLDQPSPYRLARSDIPLVAPPHGGRGFSAPPRFPPHSLKVSYPIDKADRVQSRRSPHRTHQDRRLQCRRDAPSHDSSIRSGRKGKKVSILGFGSFEAASARPAGH